MRFKDRCLFAFACLVAVSNQHSVLPVDPAQLGKASLLDVDGCQALAASDAFAPLAVQAGYILATERAVKPQLNDAPADDGGIAGMFFLVH